MSPGLSRELPRVGRADGDRVPFASTPSTAPLGDEAVAGPVAGGWRRAGQQAAHGRRLGELCRGGCPPVALSGSVQGHRAPAPTDPDWDRLPAL